MRCSRKRGGAGGTSHPKVYNTVLSAGWGVEFCSNAVQYPTEGEGGTCTLNGLTTDDCIVLVMSRKLELNCAFLNALINLMGPGGFKTDLRVCQTVYCCIASILCIASSYSAQCRPQKTRGIG